MNFKNMTKLFGALVVLSMLLAACGTGAAQPTSAVGVPFTTGDKLDAGSCDYGGQIRSIEATDRLTVVFTLCRPDPAFLVKIAFTPFGIEPKEWIESASVSKEILDHPVGTGPYMVTEWDRGNQIVYTRFDDYWGTKAPAQTAVLKWLTESAARLQELQAGTADFASNMATADLPTVLGDANLQAVYQANPNVFYIGMTNTFPPFDDVRVRQAIAMGVDRQRIVDNFYAPGSEVASHFTPCSIPNGCQGEDWYEFDPVAAKALLAEAGYPNGFDTTISYRDVSRAYLEAAPPVAQELQAQLKANLNINAEIIPVESGAYVAATTSGETQGIHMFGWGADYPHITNFLDYHFNQNNPQLGTPYPEIYEPLLQASSIGDPATAAPLYEQANNAIKQLAPLVPIAHGLPAHAALASLKGAYYPPFGAPNFNLMDPGKDTLVFIQNAEPLSLYCADETDGESLTACQQVIEGLLAYAPDSAETVPALATSCDPNTDSTVWTCHLRDGVRFHDGSDFDANDVVASLSAGFDAASPYHIGNTGAFDYFVGLWGGLINAPPAE